MKTKTCEKCHQQVNTAYRIQISKGKNWVFYCEECVHEHKKLGAYYRYGGTWKGYRH